MATAASLDLMKKEVICSICLDFYKDPVIIECGHNFCRACLNQFWELRSEQDSIVSCPECRQVFGQKSVRPNRQLANVAVQVQALQSSGLGEARQAARGVCQRHKEKLKLYCEEDDTPICVVCGLSRKHRAHSMLPIEEAASEYKEKLEKTLSSLKKQMEDVQRIRQEEEQKIEQIKVRVASKRQNIIAEFDHLLHFLQKEREAHLVQLEEEETSVLRKVNENLIGLSQQSESLDQLLREVKDLSNLEDEAFLMGIKSALDRCTASLQSPAGVPIDSILKEISSPLQYFIWRKMINFIKPAPAPITLDPNTAHPLLILSEDGTALRLGDSWQDVPDYPERFDSWLCVLGSEGFSFGRHYWEVKVRDSTVWTVGVARESVRKKGGLEPMPATGYWTMRLWGKTGYCAGSSPHTPLLINEKPRRIGVYLDYDGGQLSFYNVDNMSHLYTYNSSFTEKMFPFFYTGNKEPPIKLCHLCL